MVKARVLIVRTDNSGDVLLAGPAIRAVATGAEQATLWCGPRGRPAAHSLPGVDQVLCHELAWIDPEPSAVKRGVIEELVARLQRLDADEAFILTSFHQTSLPTALLLRLAGMPFIAAISEDYPGSLLDVRHRVDPGLHEVERSLSLVATRGYRLPPGDDGCLHIAPSGMCNPAADWRPYVVVHPGATAPARTWEPGRHAALVEALRSSGWRVVVTGSEREARLTRAVAGPPRPNVLDLGGRTCWPELAEVLRGADAVVTGNTGPAHLAAAVRTPVACLYAPTVPAQQWRPWKVPHVLLGEQDIACAGCRARACPRPGHPCLGSVTVDTVLAAVDALAGVPDALQGVVTR